MDCFFVVKDLKKPMRVSSLPFILLPMMQLVYLRR